MPAPLHFVRTRIAPTPSGFLHIGNLYSFALTQRLAREYGARVLLRIDDLDASRASDRYIDDIFSTLSFMRLTCDEGPIDTKDFHDHWSQRHRVSLYEDALKELVAKNLVFACTCSRSKLAAGGSCDCRQRKLSLETPNAAWRLDTSADLKIVMKSLQGDVHAELPQSMRNFIVRRRDGLPSYQLSSLVDDVHFKVDVVVRGQDLWESTIAQLYLAQLLGLDTFLQATFHHHPLLKNAKGEKLSKSAGHRAVQTLREEGKSAEEIYGMVERIREKQYIPSLKITRKR